MKRRDPMNIILVRFPNYPDIRVVTYRGYILVNLCAGKDGRQIKL